MAQLPWKYKFIDLSSWVTVGAGFFRGLQENGYSGVVFRVGVGSSKDTRVDQFFAQCRAEAPGLKIGWYYVPNPLYSISANMAYLRSFLGSLAWDFGCGDYERTFGVSSATYLLFLVAFQDAMIAAFPYVVLSYSAKWFMDTLGNHSRLRDYLWWVAVYYTSTSVYPPYTATPWAIPRQLLMEDIAAWQFYAKWHEPYSPSDLDANVGYGELDSLFSENAPRYLLIALPDVRIRSGPYVDPILGVSVSGSVWEVARDYPYLIDRDGKEWYPIVGYVAGWLTEGVE